MDKPGTENNLSRRIQKRQFKFIAAIFSEKCNSDFNIPKFQLLSLGKKKSLMKIIVNYVKTGGGGRELNALFVSPPLYN